jgi:hypothetical protein
MNQKIKELLKAYDKITDNKEVHSKLNIATTLREEIQIVIKELSKKL